MSNVNNEESIFDEAIKIESASKRAAYLKSACKGDEELLARVEALLKVHYEDKSFLKSPTIDPDVTLDNAVLEGPGTRIGRYELLEMIGEGGMGLVYLAEQKEPVRRQVALKIIKPGMDSRQVIARFEAERQALALLDHSNIARVLDAGTTETSRPYFVMEYVKGMSITKYCDRHKLSVEKRLKLFLRVCEAVHHAHQKGIIHRDIKPSNILVSVQDDRAVPKIIDFGIAKAIAQPLTQQTLFTRQGQLLGTPEYMSPEQADMGNEDTDTRADIYSLGVVLYELLTGVLPFEHGVLEKVGFAELQRILQEQEPPRPSLRFTALGEKAKEIAERRHTQVVALARRLHRELEWIPLKAMRKDRSRRYRSASELADDIQNYLSGAPLIAGPETAVYRVKKFVRRHAGSVATVALVVVAIVLGLVISTAMYFQAEKARGIAEEAKSAEAKQRRIAESEAIRAEQEANRAKEESEAHRRTLYVTYLSMAKEAYNQRNIRRVRELLESCQADLRGWEWYRLNHIADQYCMTLVGRGDKVWAAFSPDGKHIISGSDDGTIKVWDAATGAELMTLRGHGGEVWSAEFSPDGKRIASASGDKTVKIWDAATGAELMTLRGHENSVENAVFSPDGKRIVSGSQDKTIRVWDAATGAELMTLQGHRGRVKSVAFSPDGKRIVSGSLDETIKVWDAATGAKLMTLRGHKWEVWSAEFSPDGKQIVSGGSAVKVWDAATGAELMTLRGHGNWVVRSVAFSPDGKHIVSGSADKTIKVWDAATGAELMILRGHAKEVWSVVFSPDGKRIVSGAGGGRIKVWDTTRRAKLMTLRGHENEVWSVVFSPDGKRIVSGSADQTIKVWDVDSGAELMTLVGHSGTVNSLAFSPDGKRIVSGSGKLIKVWDAKTGDNPLTLRGHQEQVYALTISPDGKRIVSGSGDKTIKVWDAISGEELMTLPGHTYGTYVASFSPDGTQIISSGGGGNIKIWDVKTGVEQMTLSGHEKGIYSVSFSPDGKRIVSGSNDKTIKVWDAATGAELMTLRGHDEEVYSAVFSPDGKRIVSCSSAGTIKVWDATSGAELMTLVGHGEFWLVAFSPDGKTIAAGGYGGRIKLWESTSPAGGYEPRRTANAARKIVDELYEKHGLYHKVIDELKADKTLDKSVRKIALQIANARLWEDAEKLEKERVDLASLYINEGRYDEAEALLGKALGDMRQGGKAYFLALASIDNLVLQYIDEGRYDEAKMLFVKVVELNPENAYNSYRIALLQLYTGDIEGYRKTCTWMLDHFARNERLDNTNWVWVVRICSLAPDAVKDLAHVVRLAEQGLESGDKTDGGLNRLGVILYRAGRFEEAIENLEELVTTWEKEGRLPTLTSPAAYTWFFLAMAHHQSGQPEEAKKWLAKATERAEQEVAGNLSWPRQLALELFGAEAKLLLGVLGQ